MWIGLSFFRVYFLALLWLKLATKPLTMMLVSVCYKPDDCHKERRFESCFCWSLWLFLGSKSFWCNKPFSYCINEGLNSTSVSSLYRSFWYCHTNVRFQRITRQVWRISSRLFEMKREKNTILCSSFCLFLNLSVGSLWKFWTFWYTVNSLELFLHQISKSDHQLNSSKLYAVINSF